MKQCVIENCGELGTHKGYCFKHYLETKRTFYYKIKHPKIKSRNIWTPKLQEELEKLLNIITKKQNPDIIAKKELHLLNQIRKRQSKYHRNLKWILLFPNPFNNSFLVEYHHINNTYVVAIPKDLHKLYNGNSRKIHREFLVPIVNQIYSKPQEQKTLNSLARSILVEEDDDE